MIQRGTHLPLGREVTVTSGDTDQERVVGLEDVGGDDRDFSALGRRIHFGQNILRQCLSDSN